MSWSFARAVVYLACLAASALSLAGLARFDPATGEFDLHAFNLYALAGGGGGVVASGLAVVALLRGWGRR